MNYVHKVERPNGSATKVTVNAHGIYLTFAKGMDGRPLEVSRYKDAMVRHGSLYVPRVDYVGAIRQVAAILNQGSRTSVPEPKKPTQLGFKFNKNTDRCPGCTKGTTDTSNCFDSCPLNKFDSRPLNDEGYEEAHHE